MKIFTSQQIPQLDQYTIEHEPIASIDLMERAANALFEAFKGAFSYLESICILAGQGNNGGDALALARLLLNSGYPVTVLLIHTGNLSHDCDINRQRLLSTYPNSLNELNENFIAPIVSDKTILVDGLFGSGLSRPLTGIFAQAVQWINQTGCTVVAIDIPSGLSGEENKLTEESVIVKASLTLSLQFPKLAFLMVENAPYVGNWHLLNIGIHPEAIAKTSTNLFYLEENDIVPLLKKRAKFSHKGTFGHALIIAGSKGMAGSSVLASKAALRAGAGLVTVHGPGANRVIVQGAIPEVIFQSDASDNNISNINSFDMFDAIAIGPGIGTSVETAEMLKKLIKKLDKPSVIDADALNIIAQQKDLLHLLAKNSILTPHPKEFDRLFGDSNSSYERTMKAHKASKDYALIIVLKGAYTLIAYPDGNLYFNSTGNSGMATAGSGDVLTGILVGLLAQSYKPEDAAKIGVFLHGRAGDLALKKESQESLMASDIIKRLGESFLSLKNK